MLFFGFAFCLAVRYDMVFIDAFLTEIFIF